VVLENRYTLGIWTEDRFSQGLTFSVSGGRKPLRSRARLSGTPEDRYTSLELPE
jgi:hypothetical protein